MKSNRFAFFSWGVLACTLAVIVWGAYVRASGSGAGCGSHWPLCNGDIIPRDPQLKTIIELTHRLTSGVALVLVIILFAWAWRAFPRHHRVRRGAALSLLFMVTEALVGAGLVLFELVADNASMARAMFMAVHLMNTFMLIGSITLTAWWGSGGGSLRLRLNDGMTLLAGVSLLAMLILAASGAVAALGDTLFPSASLAEALKQDLSPTSHLLIQLRVLHPLLAVFAGFLVITTAVYAGQSTQNTDVKRWSVALFALVLVQMGVGALNVTLLAPIWLQFVHLLLADFVWIALVLMSASALSQPATATTGERAITASDASALSLSRE